MRGHNPLWIGLAALALGGCTVIFGDVDKAECQTDYDCPGTERCATHGRCVNLSLVEFDAEPLDVETRDMAPPPDRAPPPDMAPDMGPDMTPDLGETGPPFPNGDCFDGDGAELLVDDLVPESDPAYALHIPQFACTPYALVWTIETAEGVSVVWDTDGDLVAEHLEPVDGEGGEDPRDVEPVALAFGGRYAVEGPHLLVPHLNTAENTRPPNILHVDLRDGARDFIAPSSYPQRDPVRVDGRTLMLEAVPGGGEQVIVVAHGEGIDAYQRCGRGGVRQWGAAGGPGWTAWFEQRAGSRLPRLVVTDARCTGPRRERLLPRPVSESARLWPVPGGVVWLQPSEDARANQIYAWFFERVGAEPGPLAGPAASGNPIELVTRGAWLSVVGYSAAGGARYPIDLVDLDDGALSADRDGRRPALSDRYLMWVEFDTGDNTWRLSYEHL